MKLHSSVTDVRYFVRREFSKSLVFKKDFGLIMVSGAQVIIFTLSKEVG